MRCERRNQGTASGPQSYLVLEANYLELGYFIWGELFVGGAATFLDIDCRFGSDRVLLTASVSIARNSALVLGGCLKDFCH